jgi:hypothetical protein
VSLVLPAPPGLSCSVVGEPPSAPLLVPLPLFGLFGDDEQASATHARTLAADAIK